MKPIEKVLSALSDPVRKLKPAGKNKWSARCPCHHDRNASLGIGVFEDGGAWVKCHAGCDREDVLAAMGLTVADLQPDRPTKQDGKLLPKTGKAWPTLEGATEAVRRIVAKKEDIPVKDVIQAGTWTYQDGSGKDIAAVIRFDLPTAPGEPKSRKTFRPVHRAPGGWAMGDPAGKWPLFRLAALKGAERAFVCEGEKAAGAAGSCGLVATTSAHGSQSPEKTDWSPLAAKETIIIPDHDAAGEDYARRVAAEIRRLNPAAVVKVLRLADLAGDDFPAGGDFADFSAEFRDGKDAEVIAQEINAAADKASAGTITAHGVRAGQSEKCPEPVLICAADVKTRAVNWLWRGRISRGRITVLAGHAGEGKSFLTTDLASRVTRGIPWPDGEPCTQGSVLFVCAEDSAEDTIVPRLKQHGADLLAVQILSGVSWRAENGDRKEVVFTLHNLAALEEAIERVKPILILIDPIGSFLGGKTDAHRDNEVRAVLAPLARLAEKYDAAVLIVAHRPKAGGTRADDLVIGSRAFTALARSVLHLIADVDDPDRKLLTAGKNNLGRKAVGLAFRIVGDEPGKIEWEEGPVEMTADEALAMETAGKHRRAPGPEPRERDAACDFLRKLLSAGGMDLKAIRERAAQAELNWRTVQRAAEEMGIERIRPAFGKGGRWILPDSRACQNAAQGPQDGKDLSSCHPPMKSKVSDAPPAQNDKLIDLGTMHRGQRSNRPQDPGMRTPDKRQDRREA